VGALSLHVIQRCGSSTRANDQTQTNKGESLTCLRLYELGKKKLLRKCEYKNIPAGLMWLEARGDKIFAADLREGFHVFKYR